MCNLSDENVIEDLMRSRSLYCICFCLRGRHSLANTFILYKFMVSVVLRLISVSSNLQAGSGFFQLASFIFAS